MRRRVLGHRRLLLLSGARLLLLLLGSLGLLRGVGLALRVLEDLGRYGEVWGDTGRCREM